MMIIFDVEALFANKKEILDMMIEYKIHVALFELCSHEQDQEILV